MVVEGEGEGDEQIQENEPLERLKIKIEKIFMIQREHTQTCDSTHLFLAIILSKICSLRKLITMKLLKYGRYQIHSHRRVYHKHSHFCLESFIRGEIAA